MSILIEDLPTTTIPTAGHVVPAMKEGETYKLSVQQIIDLCYAAISNGAPETLDTLNELAAALADDEDYATTITAALATKFQASDIANLSEMLAGAAGKIVGAEVLQSRKGETAWADLEALSTYDLTGVDPDADRIRIFMDEMSLTTSGNFYALIGNGGGFSTTGYESSSILTTGGAITRNGETTMFHFVSTSNTLVISGIVELIRDGSDWFLSSMLTASSGWTVQTVGRYIGFGPITQIQIGGVSGVFDAGSRARLKWEQTV